MFKRETLRVPWNLALVLWPLHKAKGQADLGTNAESKALVDR